MNDYRTSFVARLLAMSLAGLVSGVLMLIIDSERAALIAAVVACIVVLAGWEYWHWKARRRS